MPKIEMGKRYRECGSRDFPGRKVDRILCVDHVGPYPVVYAIGDEIVTCMSDGQYYAERSSRWDLIEDTDLDLESDQS